MSKPTGGGKATTAGTTFQENVITYHAVLVLAEKDAVLLGGVGTGVTLDTVRAETFNPVDDILATTSNGGRLYFQAKTTLPLSVGNSSFRSVADQFVHQFLVGSRVTTGARKSFDRSTDRLFLAVGARASNPVRVHLRSALNTMRSAQHSGLRPQVRAGLNRDESRALDIYERGMRDAAKRANLSLTDDVLASLVTSSVVLDMDLEPDGAERNVALQYLKTSVLVDGTQAESAWALLVNACRSFSPQRTGGDRDYFKSVLASAGLQVRSPKSFASDIQGIKEDTGRRIQRISDLAHIPFYPHPIKIERLIVDSLVEYARSGHLLVIGLPGSGKSGCLHAFAERMRSNNAEVVLVPVDHIDANTDRSLNQEMGSEQDFVDVLANWEVPNEAYLVIDALDAARSNVSLTKILNMMADVMKRATNWTVVASVREYDLRHSSRLQDLFKGAPHLIHRNHHYLKSRHIEVAPLTDEEIDQVRTQSHDISTAIDSASDKCRNDLIRNPFNLRIFCDLVADNQGADLASVKTELELLDAYWRVRTEVASGSVALRPALKQITSKMAKARRLNCMRDDVDAEGKYEIAIKTLLRSGILTEAQSALDGADSRLAFSHNILFDYAVAREQLGTLDDDVLAWLAKPDNQDLLIALRPSIILAFQRLWHLAGPPSRTFFWDRAIALQRREGMRLVGKVIASSVAAREFRAVADAEALLKRITDGADPDAQSLLKHMATAAIANHKEFPDRHALLGPNAAEWMPLADAVATCALDSMFWTVRGVLTASDFATDGISDSQFSAAGNASRRLLAHVYENRTLSHTLSTVVELVCKTLNSNPAASIDALSQCLDDEALLQNIHLILDHITQFLPTLAEADLDFALRVIRLAFSTDGDRDEWENMGGRILGMRFNKHDMVEMARYHIGELFGTIMSQNPVVGTKLAVCILEAAASREGHFELQGAEESSFIFHGKQAVLIHDHSSIWAQGDHNTHEVWHKVITSFIEGLGELDGGKSE